MMQYFILVVLIIALLIGLTGCDSVSNDSTRSQQQQPPPPQPEPEPEPEVPSVGVGALNYKATCESGFATITYVYQDDSNIDPNSFIIAHSVNGDRQDLIIGSVLSNGSVSRMEEQIFIDENTGEDQLAHEITITFVSAGINQLQSFSFLQPSCEEEPEEPQEVSMTIDLDLK